MRLKNLWQKLFGRKVQLPPRCVCECKRCDRGDHCSLRPNCEHPTMDDIYPKSPLERDSVEE